MLDKVHTHILDELRINARTDTIFIITTLIADIVLVSVNSAIATDLSSPGRLPIIFGLLILMTLVLSFVAEIALIKGRQASRKLIEGLMKMYEDQKVDQYYSPSLLKHYKIRYNLFILVLLLMGIISVIIPILMID